ncbi:FecCD family ABC transporter permease [Paenibacillus radicis (ex Xue et al. 2023)]|uniref:Iron ABC transporter permease n=1 Tax=Paenibacillus radicis (ex Xue et al. 2023) TaxID=2972489 RepID=A0ABT1YQ03_9BACL|nr:iron ABC transporter permease [Paenibacillus radicis (ex Xue et al. 2023)]MCR8635097.1 iron ABC transporter permease [Paenibacillus radicis (ex Xue et al. 2023)]
MNRYAAIRAQRLRFSVIVDMKGIWILLSVLLFLAALMVTSIGIGTLYISPLRTLQILFGGPNGEAMETTIIWNFRLPRIILASLAGMALALAGTILQAVVRNPLASPDIIGITSGAAMMAVLFLAIFNATISIFWMPLFSFAGAVIVSIFIYLVAWKKGVSSMRMILVGLGVSALLEALKTLFMIFSPIAVLSQAKIWITGTVYGANWNTVKFFSPWFLLFLPILFILVRRMNIQVLGNELPVLLGGRIQLQRFALIFTAAGLAGSAVAFVGGIGFVGLMAPHISRRLVGGSHGVLLVCSAAVGAILLVTADLVGRTLFAPKDIPAGVFTAVLGAPFFLYMLIKVKKKQV